MKTGPDGTVRLKRAVRIVLVVIAVLFTAMMWSGVTLRDLLAIL
jgi:hypothetical protein